MPFSSFYSKSTAFFLLLLIITLAGNVRAELLDRVVAVVNDDVITLSELNKEGSAVFRNIMEQAPPQEAESVILKARQELLSQMIDNKLVEQRAAQLNVTVSDDEVAAAIDRVLERNKVSMTEFQRELVILGRTEAEYRENVKSQILQSKLISYEIRSKIVITDSKIQEHYNAHYAQKAEEGDFHILQLGLKWDEGDPANKEIARKRIEEVREKALDGEDFRKLARQYSTLPSAVDGGDIGLFSEKDLALYMRDTILSMKQGEISPIIETPAGFQFFMLLSTKGDAGATQVPTGEIAEKIRETLYEEEMEKQFTKWVSQLREEAYIKILL